MNNLSKRLRKILKISDNDIQDEILEVNNTDESCQDNHDELMGLTYAREKHYAEFLRARNIKL